MADRQAPPSFFAAVAAPVTQLIAAFGQVLMVHGKAGKQMAAGHVLAAAGSDPALGRIALVAVAVAAVAAFTVLQIRARSRRPARPVRRRRSRPGYDWRTLPPQYSEDTRDEPPPRPDHDDYGPLWRYGSPRGYGRDYGPGHRPEYGPGYRPDDGLRARGDEPGSSRAGRA